MVVFLTPQCSGPHDPPHDPALKAELPTIFLFVFTEDGVVRGNESFCYVPVLTQALKHPAT